MIPIEPASFTKEFERTKEGALVNRNMGGLTVYHQQLAKREAEKARDETTKAELKALRDDMDFLKAAMMKLLENK